MFLYVHVMSVSYLLNERKFEINKIPSHHFENKIDESSHALN